MEVDRFLKLQSTRINPQLWMLNVFIKLKSEELKGIFTAAIDSAKYQELIELLNYVDFENLTTNYAVSWTDDQSCTLRITYDGGKTKIINDYGLIGTFGLDKVYQLLFSLRETQKWRK